MFDAKYDRERIVVVGGANIDLQGRSFEAFLPADSNPGTIIRSRGGVGRNIAENCVLLGLPTWLLTAFGDDEDGAWLRSDCERKGIDTEGSLIAHAATARYLCVMDPSGSLQAAVADMGIMERLDPGFLESRRLLLDSADIIVADANLPAASLAWLAAQYGRSGRRGRGKIASRQSPGPLLYLDTVSKAKAARAAGLAAEFDCVKPNRAEASILAKFEGTEAAEPEILCEAMASQEGLPAELFISLGEKGIYYHTEAGEIGYVHLPPPELRPLPVNRSGAGDAACAALVWARIRGVGAIDKARYALAAAMLTAASSEPVDPEMNETTLETQMRRMYPME
ncbi:MAG: PfkB family carbohydrate kinase [Rectinemataceae bacterium]